MPSVLCFLSSLHVKRGESRPCVGYAWRLRKVVLWAHNSMSLSHWRKVLRTAVELILAHLHASFRHWSRILVLCVARRQCPMFSCVMRTGVPDLVLKQNIVFKQNSQVRVSGASRSCSQG